MLQSCNFLFGGYGWDEFFSRDNPVSTRADTLTDIADSPAGTNTDYTVIVITDVHFGGDGTRPDDSFFEWVSSLSSRPKFCICLGDIAEHGYKSEYTDYVAFTAKLYNTYGIRTYTVTGNHDLYNSGWKYWHTMVYPYTSFYRLKTVHFSWYFLDSGSGSLGTTQYNTLKNAMNADSNPKIVLLHYPIYADGTLYLCLQNTYERDELITLFAKKNVKLVLDGHTHQYHTCDFGSFYEFNVPGFLAKGQWALLTVNETTGTVHAELIVR
jgi:3',5'-cyclic AMP phosphodiesterase CpdA